MGNRRRLPSILTDPIASSHETMLRLEQREKESNERREKSLEALANDPERLAKQQAFKLEKEENLRIKEETEKILSKKMPILMDKLLAEAAKTSPDWAMTTLKDELEEFKELDNKHFEAANKVGNRKIKFYETLLVELNKINPEFLFVAPISMFAQTKDLKVGNLSNEQKLSLQEKLVGENEITNNLFFIQNYAKHFPNFINRITNPDDIITACSIDASAYKNIRPTVLATIWNSPRSSNKLIKTAPQVILYVSDEDLNNILINNREAYLYAVAKCPKVLKRLPSDYFNDKDPDKFFKFARTYKFDLAEIMYPYASHFINPDGSNTFKAYLEGKYLDKVRVKTTLTSQMDDGLTK